MNLPPLELEDCEETTLLLKWNTKVNNGEELEIEYKNAIEDWSSAKRMKVEPPGSLNMEIYDLEPGTPYCLRLRLGVEVGPASVFDTVPVGCTPKDKEREKNKRKCAIC
jgi:hypothetical protein